MTIDDVLQENALCKEENNRLNDIISEDIKQLKDNVTSLDNAIIANSGSIAENTDTITYVAATVEGNTAQITDMAENVDNLETMLEDYIHTQDVNSVRGGWCAFKNIWKTDNSIIKYDRLTFEDTNMDTTHTGTPLNIDTGVFTVPKSGVWRVSYSLKTVIGNHSHNYAYLYHNGDQIPESTFHVYSTVYLYEVGGRELLLKAEEGDSISLRTGDIGSTNDNYGFYEIFICVEFKSL